jgi:hypothetical protein
MSLKFYVLNLRAMAVLLSGALMAGQTAADSINGRVLGGGAPIANSKVTLWAASTGAPTQLAQASTGTDGRFTMNAEGASGSLYLVAKGGTPAANKANGDNPAIALMTVLGTRAPAQVIRRRLSCRRKSDVR